jgi:hypothetical protein
MIDGEQQMTWEWVSMVPPTPARSGFKVSSLASVPLRGENNGGTESSDEGGASVYRPIYPNLAALRT